MREGFSKLVALRALHAAIVSNFTAAALGNVEPPDLEQGRHIGRLFAQPTPPWGLAHHAQAWAVIEPPPPGHQGALKTSLYEVSEFVTCGFVVGIGLTPTERSSARILHYFESELATLYSVSGSLVQARSCKILKLLLEKWCRR